ncbi:Nucleolar GTP-binding protein 1, variant 2 [Entomophthora muscae]|uniref:Nucleolar GTP-binding protein 1, variant 2 n=2 Tax=Entomophthora muscae TaxID=34485 RepID=A0ACC2RSN7_9FUNG|nr:Nucleolar GTP-binding protein 1, variant 2 [Entomophthora muscae]
MTSIYNFKRIQVVPSAMDFLDIVLSKTQRKTPTVIHKNFKISRIRNFYMRKVKFTQDSFEEKMRAMLEEFPMLNSIHPFYADLMNVLYDKDHYKLALGQINTARTLINNVAKDYVKLMKFADSLYRCKQLKKAALGRMATIMRRQKDSLAYLEQVRQHLARLPSIDPNTRTLLVCGYPNVGKSSFLNKVTRADVDVQPYAFTTKSLFVGHMDYKYLRWQVIDTPGILDHPLEERNTIEMQSITAMAHLRACIMFFIDLSEQCGYSIAQQISLYNSIKPLFANKPTVLCISKIDIKRPEDLTPEDQALVQGIIDRDGLEVALFSSYTDEGVMETRNKACDKLLASRVDMKLKGHKIGDILNKLHLAMPQQRDNTERLPVIPEGVNDRVKFDLADPNRPRLERDLELENGGAGVYNVDLKKKYMLEDEEWKYDAIPEIMDGKNVADFIDPDIFEKLEALEREEEQLEQEGAYNSEEEIEDPDEEIIRAAASKIREKKQIIIKTSRIDRNKANTLGKKLVANRKSASAMAQQLSTAGYDPTDAVSTVKANSGFVRKPLPSKPERDHSVVAKDGSLARRDRSVMGLKNMQEKAASIKIQRSAQKIPNLMGKRGESDRVIINKLPKHLFSGKRKGGSTDRR